MQQIIAVSASEALKAELLSFKIKSGGHFLFVLYQGISKPLQLESF